jgi:two-component system, NtrC family, response regulator HupR/HoxA
LALSSIIDTPLDWASLFSLHFAQTLADVLHRKFLASLIGVLPSKEAYSPLVAKAPTTSQQRTDLVFEAAPKSSDGLVFFEAQLSAHAFEQGVSLRHSGQWQGSLSIGPLSTSLSSTERDHLRSLLELLAKEALTLQSERHFAPSQYTTKYTSMIGRSVKMQELFRLLNKVCDSDSTVLIQGENGTGKELIAHAIHQNSSRRDKPFVIQNCSAFNDNLLDSELFGHKRGAFTGAVYDKRGLFTVAHTGTFFLDEVGDMSPQLQVKLLRVLEEGTFQPIGDTVPVHVDVRIVAATNRDLQRMVEEKTFREDLYYRIHVLHVLSPPLRERLEDIPLLVDFFLQRLSGVQKLKKKLSAGCMARFMTYHWPGNVRELSHEIERLWVLSGDDPQLREELLSPRLFEKKVEPRTMPEAVEVLERRMILDSMLKHRWNKTRAATELGVSRRNLIRKCKEYNIAPIKKR